MKFAKALVLGCLTTLTTTAALAQSQSGWVQIRHLGGFVRSHDFVNGRGQQAEDLNNNYWNFYYKFVNNVSDLNKTACFAGEEVKAMEAIDKTKGFVGDQETPTIQNLRYDQSRDTIQFSIMNRRPEVRLDENALVQIEVPRCGNAREVQPTVADIRDSQRSFFEFLVGARPEAHFTVNHVPAETGISTRSSDLMMKNEKCSVWNNLRLGQPLSIKAGDTLAMRIKTLNQRGDAIIFGLYAGEGFEGASLSVVCKIPTTSTVQELEQALDGMFSIK